MKRALYIVIGVFVFDAILATTYRINIEKNDRKGTVEVRAGRLSAKLREGESISFGNLGYGKWDGERFIFSGSGVSSLCGSVDTIMSTDVPITFESFYSSNCKISSPKLRITGRSFIDNLVVQTFYGEDNAVDIIGNLTTKNLNISGDINVQGELNVKGNKGSRNINVKANEFTINGTLRYLGGLGLKASSNITNNGEILVDTDIIKFLSRNFKNGDTGKVTGRIAKFETFCRLHNYGSFSFDQINFDGMMFFQRGEFYVREEAFFYTDLDSYGKTNLSHLKFSRPSRIKVSGGETFINKVSGGVSEVSVDSGGVANIGSIEGEVGYLASEGENSVLTVDKVISDSRVGIYSRFGGKTTVKEVDTPSSLASSKDGELNISNVRGNSEVLVCNSAKAKIGKADNLKIVANDKSEANVEKSKVNKAFLSEGKHLFNDSEISLLYNESELDLKNVKTQKIYNSKRIKLVEDNKVGCLLNSGDFICTNGSQRIDTYRGGYFSSNSKLSVQSSLGNELDDENTKRTVLNRENLEKEDENTEVSVLSNESTGKNKEEDTETPMTLKDEGVQVFVHNFSGTGNVEAKQQTYRGVVPLSLKVKGDVVIDTDKLVIPARLPLHEEGKLTVKVNMDKDFVNNSDIDYKDVNIHMNMNGFNWTNNSEFLARTLKVENAKKFSNVDSRISVDGDIEVSAEKISNESTPAVKTVQIDQAGVYYLGEQKWDIRYGAFDNFYSKGKGIIRSRSGKVDLKGSESIDNKYSSIVADQGYKIDAKRVANRLGDLISLGNSDSYIRADKFEHESLPSKQVYVGRHDRRHCLGLFCNKAGLFKEHNQSGKSTIYSRGDLKIEIGESARVRGSDIFSENDISLGLRDKRSLEIKNEHKLISEMGAGGNIHLKGGQLNIDSSRITSRKDIELEVSDGNIYITNDLPEISYYRPFVKDGYICMLMGESYETVREAKDIDLIKEIKEYANLLEGERKIEVPEELHSEISVIEEDNLSRIVVNSIYRKLLPLVLRKHQVEQSEYEGNKVLQFLIGKGKGKEAEDEEQSSEIVKVENQLGLKYWISDERMGERELILTTIHLPRRSRSVGIGSMKGKIKAKASQIRVDDSMVLGEEIKIEVKSEEADTERNENLPIEKKGKEDLPKDLPISKKKIKSGDGTFTATGSVILATKGNLDIDADKGSIINARRNVISHYNFNGSQEMYWEEIRSIPMVIGAVGEITFSGGNTTIRGTKIRSKVFNDNTSNMLIGANKTRLHFWSRDEKTGVFSSKTLYREGFMDSAEFSSLNCETVNSRGESSLTLESVDARGVKKFICSKPMFKESAVTLEYYDKTTIDTKGVFFGGFSVSDPLIDAFISLQKANNDKALLFSSISTAANVLGTVNDVAMAAKILTSTTLDNPLTLFVGLLCRRFVHTSMSISNLHEEYETRKLKQVPTIMPNVDIIILRNKGEVHLQGIHRAKRIEIDTQKLTSEGFSEINSAKYISRGWGASFNPIMFAITVMMPNLSIIQFGEKATMAMALAASTSVSMQHHDSNNYSKIHDQTEVIGDDCKIKVVNAYLKDTQIRGKSLKVKVAKDLILESSQDEHLSNDQGRSYSAGLGFLAPQVKKGNTVTKLEQAGMAIAGVGIGVIDRERRSKRVNNITALTGEETFNLEVGGDLKVISSYYGQKKLADQILVPRMNLGEDNSLEEIIVKGEIKHEELKDENYSSDGSYNASIGDLYRIISEFILKKDGEEEEEAKEEKDKQINKQIKELEEKQKNANRKVKKPVKKLIRKLKSLEKKIVEQKAQKGKNEDSDELIKEQLKWVDKIKQTSLKELNEEEQKEKVRRANKAVMDAKNKLIACGKHWLVDQINESSIRKGAEAEVAKDYKLHREVLEVRVKTYVDFLKGEGFETKPRLEQVWVTHDISVDYYLSVEELNEPENRFNRLLQRNLSKIGESDEQKEIKALPIIGLLAKPYMDWKYGRAGTREAILSCLGNISGEFAAFLIEGAAIGKVARAGFKLVSKIASKIPKRACKNLSVEYLSDVNTAMKSQNVLEITENQVVKDMERLSKRIANQGKPEVSTRKFGLGKKKDIKVSHNSSTESGLATKVVRESENDIWRKSWELRGNTNFTRGKVSEVEEISKVAKEKVKNDLKTKVGEAEIINFSGYMGKSISGQQLSKLAGFEKLEAQGKFLDQGWYKKELNVINDNFWGANENEMYLSMKKLVVGGDNLQVASSSGWAKASISGVGVKAAKTTVKSAKKATEKGLAAEKVKFKVVENKKNVIDSTPKVTKSTKAKTGKVDKKPDAQKSKGKGKKAEAEPDPDPEPKASVSKQVFDQKAKSLSRVESSISGAGVKAAKTTVKSAKKAAEKELAAEKVKFKVVENKKNVIDSTPKVTKSTKAKTGKVDKKPDAQKSKGKGKKAEAEPDPDPDPKASVSKQVFDKIDEVDIDFPKTVEEFLQEKNIVVGKVSASEIKLDFGGKALGKDGYGMIFEDFIATLVKYIEARLPVNFKTFDFWWLEKGLAISVKTMNTNTLARILRPKKIYSTLKRYVDKTLKFDEYMGAGGKELFREQIKSREVILGIPENTGRAQMEQIMRAVKYGKLNDVNFKIFLIGE